MFIYIYIYTYIHTYIHTHILHIHIYTYLFAAASARMTPARRIHDDIGPPASESRACCQLSYCWLASEKMNDRECLSGSCSLESR